MAPVHMLDKATFVKSSTFWSIFVTAIICFTDFDIKQNKKANDFLKVHYQQLHLTWPFKKCLTNFEYINSKHK